VSLPCAVAGSSAGRHADHTQPNHRAARDHRCAGVHCLRLGQQESDHLGGAVWVLSALLDRADGELARLTQQSSPSGHFYDYVIDMCVNASMFVAVGIGQRHSWLGLSAVMLGLLCGITLFLCLYWSEEIESKLDPGAVVLGGGGGFDPDDLFYLIGPLAWIGAFPLMLVSGSIVLVPAAVLIGTWFWRAGSNPRVAGNKAQTRNV
jgi:archaetidylinositol phosphate synthase